METNNLLNTDDNFNDRYEGVIPFFKEAIKNGRIEISINNKMLILFWEKIGYRKVIDENGNYILVLIRHNSIVSEVKDHMLRTEIREYANFIQKDEVWEAFLKSEFIVKRNFESFKTIDVRRNNGNEEVGYLFYKNVILKVTKTNIDLIEYRDFSGFLWEKEIIKRDFIFSDEMGSEFMEFIQKIANDNKERCKSLASIIGYLIHSYKDPSLSKAIILMDSEIDVEFDEANGGTGKSLIAKAINQITPMLFIDGKIIKTTDKFRLSALSNHHRIIFFDDVKKEFDFEGIYPLITGDLSFEKKYKNAVIIPSSESPKILISSNYVVKGGGGNAEKRRKIEYEVSSYFKDVLTPFEKFGHRMFDDWDMDEWNRFDNFMVELLQFYLKNGLIEPQSINIDYNRLNLETSIDFIDFMDRIVKNPIPYLKYDTNDVLVIDKSKLLESFLNTKPNTAKRITPIIFKKWIDKYCNYYQIPTNHYKSNGNVFVELNISNLIRNESYETDAED
jgi:hypothetical protein